ncbi:hypothetical protein Cflav_PD0738 [Pedosphaera parvula Ellin514]|uniref:Uncharacterized protein n=1 Tax=Pedosphaera parvula (strain Ellin514) TaxID=320771 RepID=B9XR90_PEDPL|nr:hypothetical protein Cflav_PD0738 [Pedosphaera parvula Ellin514]
MELDGMVLDRTLWLYVKGEDEPYPTPIHGAILAR